MQDMVELQRAAAAHAITQTVRWLDSLDRQMGVTTRNFSIVFKHASAGVLAEETRLLDSLDFDIHARAALKASICIRQRATMGFLIRDGRPTNFMPEERNLKPRLHAGGVFIADPEYGDSSFGVASGSGGGDKNEVIAGVCGAHYKKRLKRLILSQATQPLQSQRLAAE